MATTLTVFVSPVARASGVPLTSAVLNGIQIPTYMSKRTIFVKVTQETETRFFAKRRVGDA